MLDIKFRLADESVRALLSYPVGFPTPGKLEDVRRKYQSEPNWIIKGYELDGDLVGCVGAEMLEPGRVEVRHIAVLPGKRNQGIGRSMLRQLSDELGLGQLAAETDGDAVGFYEKCGFEVESLGELYPGVERFRCTLES